METPSWTEFFMSELKTLKARTGLLQWEKYELSPDGKQEAREVVGYMILEVKKPPFDKVKPEVLQRVISRAVIESKDMIALNAKFVRQALNDWWMVNGDRVMMAINQKGPEVYQKIELSKDDNEKVDYLLKSYIKTLKGFKEVPKVPDYEKKGAEWKSDIERKGISYPKTGAEWHVKDYLHKQYLRENYDIYTGEKLPTWIPESQWLTQKENQVE